MTTFTDAARLEDPLSRRRRRRRVPLWLKLLLTLFVLVLLVAGAAGALAYGTGYRYEKMPIAKIAPPDDMPEAEADLAGYAAKLRKDSAAMEAQLAKFAPKETYVVVDQTLNRLYLRREGQTILEAKCSAGSGMVLKESPSKGKGRQWVFDTPRGVYKVLERVEKPVWTKPAWALIEEGKIPTKAEDFAEEGTLGEYALKLGHGYMIHGTLYERLLGRSVTHGCIRLGRDDLRVVWKETKIGTPVYIY